MALPDGPRLPTLVTTWHWVRRPLPFLEENARRFGDAFSFRLAGLPPLAAFADPEAVKEIFSDAGENMVLGKLNQNFRALFGDRSILMLDGKEHLRQRRLLLPPFHGERMEAYGQTMMELADESIDAWPLGTQFSIHRHLQAITLRVIVRTVFGVDAGARFDKLLKVVTETVELGAWSVLLFPFMQKDLGRYSPWGRYLRKRAEQDALLLAEIRMRRAAGTKGRTDILSMLIDARDEQGHAMSDEELRDQLVTLLMAGHETTATSLAWAFRWVLGTPRVEERLVEEIRSGPFTPERVAKLPFLDAIVRETLRLQPAIPIIGRFLEKPTRVGGYDLPAGTGVVCAIYLAQRRASVWTDPARFDPDRWLDKKYTPYEFFPFGGGIRRCIGMAFAIYEMKMVLATTFARAKLRLAPDLPVRPVWHSIMLVPSDGLRVVLDTRCRITEASQAAE